MALRNIIDRGVFEALAWDRHLAQFRNKYNFRPASWFAPVEAVIGHLILRRAEEGCRLPSCHPGT